MLSPPPRRVRECVRGARRLHSRPFCHVLRRGSCAGEPVRPRRRRRWRTPLRPQGRAVEEPVQNMREVDEVLASAAAGRPRPGKRRPSEKPSATPALYRSRPDLDQTNHSRQSPAGSAGRSDGQPIVGGCLGAGGPFDQQPACGQDPVPPSWFGRTRTAAKWERNSPSHALAPGQESECRRSETGGQGSHRRRGMPIAGPGPAADGPVAGRCPN